MAVAVIRVVDGGLSTELKRLGFPVEATDPLWTARYLVTNQDALKQAHCSFLEQGADVILTGTYQASLDLFKQHANTSTDDFHKLVRTGSQVALDAVEEFWQNTEHRNGRMKPVVAGSVGPFGACLHDFSEYHGQYVDNMTQRDLMAWHRPRIKALVDSGVDLLGIETIPALKEAEALREVLREFPQMKAWMTFSSKDEAHIGHGESFAEAVDAISPCPQIIAIGVNCCPAENVTSLLQSAASSTAGKPFIVYPNCPGEQWTDTCKSLCGKTTVFEFDTLVPEWIKLGAMYIGGCCGMGAPEIAHLTKLVHQSIPTFR